MGAPILTEENKVSIRRMRNAGLTLRAIGEVFGVNKATIHYVMHPRKLKDQKPQPTLKSLPEFKSAYQEYDAYQLWLRRYSVQQIAALLRKPYREIRAAIEARV